MCQSSFLIFFILFYPYMSSNACYSLPALLTNEGLFLPQIKAVTLMPAESLDELYLYLNAKFTHTGFIYN